MKRTSIAAWLLTAIPLALGSTAMAACGGGNDGGGSDDGGAAGASALGGTSGSSTAGGEAGQSNISGASNAGGAAGTGSDPDCEEGLACTTSCSGTCPDVSSAYPCECQAGVLSCDTSVCDSSTAGCVPGASCTDDCNAACPGNSSINYDCSCQTSGSLGCDMSVCLSGQTEACSRGTATGEACDPANDATCTTLDAGGTSTCSCDATNSEWQCVSG